MNWIVILFSKPPTNSVSIALYRGKEILSEELMFHFDLAGRVLFGFTSSDQYVFMSRCLDMGKNSEK